MKDGANMFESMKYGNSRLYFFGQCVSLTGSWISFVAMPDLFSERNY